MDLRSLLACFSVAIFGIAIWGHLPPSLVHRAATRRLALGLLMGCGAVSSMHVPVHVQQGVIFDLRAPLLATAGFIGGPVSAAIACALAFLYRFHLGGQGALVGCAGILTTSLLGLAAHGVTRRRGASPLDLPGLAAAVSVTFFLMTLVVFKMQWGVAIQVGGPIAVLVFGCTWLFPLSLLRDERLHALIDQNGIYRAIIETLPDSLNAKDAQSRFVAANPATARFMRAASSADLIGKSDGDFYPTEFAQGFRAEEVAVLGGATIGPIDQSVQFPDGSRRWLTTLKTPLRDDAGRVYGIITHNRDITDHKILESDLSKTQRYLQEAITNMADGLVLYDGEGRIRFCNQQYRNLFPLTADLRMAGGLFTDIIRASVLRGEEAAQGDLDAWVDQRAQALRRPGDCSIELADGRIIEARTRPLAGLDTLVVLNDITSRRHLETELLHRATHDPLTGLANRAEFEFQLAKAQDRAASSHEQIGVLMLDLDRFKQVNDTYGHAAGDALLIEVARRLAGAIRNDDVVARLGGDEFAFLLTGHDIAPGTRSLAARVLASLMSPFQTNGIELQPNGSVGLAISPIDTVDSSTLLPLADHALYEAKRRGGGVWVASGDLNPPTLKSAAEFRSAAA